jgi:DNA-binding MarR family transcriptional regulator
MDHTTELLLRLWLAERRDVRRAPVAGNRLAVLAVLALDGPRTPTQLAQSTGLSSGGLTPVLDGLVTDGFLERRAHPSDRRSSVVEASAAGRKAVETAVAGLDARVREALGKLPPDERPVVERFMRDFVDEDDRTSRVAEPLR